MRIGSLLTGCLPALLLVSCGGEPQANTPTTARPAANSQPKAEEAAKTEPEQQDPKPTKRRVRRPRINVTMVKTLFGNDPASAAAAVPSTPELVALGKALYHSKSASASGEASCATCHDLASYGSDGKKASEP